MSTTTTKRPSITENITVLQLGEFGVRVGEKVWYNTNEPLTPQSFQVNGSYKVSLSVAKSGKKYINEIIGVADATPAAVAPVAAPAPAPVAAVPVATPQTSTPNAQVPVEKRAPYRAGYDKPLSEYDLGKDRQIGRAGIVQAAMQSGAALQWAGNLDEYLANVKKIADFGLKYSQE